MVRHIDDLTAADVAVGQEWYLSVTQPPERRTYRVEAIREECVKLVPVRAGRGHRWVKFGALLSQWVLVKEAP